MAMFYYRSKHKVNVVYTSIYAHLHDSDETAMPDVSNFVILKLYR
jgi:hypothetical protein